MTNPEELQRRFIGTSAKIWLTVVASVLLVGITARPAWRALKAFRADGFAGKAEAAWQSGEWGLAFREASAALRLVPGHSRALRVAAGALARSRDVAAYPFFDRLLTTPEAGTGDRQDYVALALLLGDTNLAAAHLEVLEGVASPSPRTRILGAKYRLLIGDPAGAVVLAREAMQADPADPTNAFTLAAALLAGNRAAERDQALEILWPLAQTNGPSQVDALVSILTAPEAPRADRERVEAILRAKPEPTVEEQIAWYDARLSLEPARSRELAAEAIARVRPQDDRELFYLVTWLTGRGFGREASALLLGERVYRSRRLFRARLEALLSAGEAQKAYEFLFDPRAPLGAFELEEMRCRAAIVLDDAGRRDVHLEQAAKLVGLQTTHATRFTELAALAGDPGAALPIWRTLARFPPAAPVALRQITRLAQVVGDTVGERDAWRQLSRLEPENAAARRGAALADLLLGENVEEAMAEVGRQLREDPDDPEIRAAVALGELRRGDVGRAQAALQGTALRLKATTPGVLAIIVAAYAASGMTNEAVRMLANLPLARLRPEERELIRPVLLVDSRLASGRITP